MQQLKRAAVVGVERADGRGLLHRPSLIVDVGQQAFAIVEPAGRDLRRQREIADAIIAAVRIGVDDQRIEVLPEPAGRLAVALFDEPRHVVLELGRAS